MWTTKAAGTSTAPPDSFWTEWTSLQTWPVWVPVFKWAVLNGPFTPGTWGRLQMQNLPGLIGWIMCLRPQKWKITEVEKNKIFNDYAPQPLAKVWFLHSLQQDDSGNTIVAIEIKITGPLSGFYGMLVGKLFKQILPQAISNLVRLAEQKQASSVPAG